MLLRLIGAGRESGDAARWRITPQHPGAASYLARQADHNMRVGVRVMRWRSKS